MFRGLRFCGILTAAMAVQVASAHAQFGYNYPGGYGGWGWGWGGTTVAGDTARGMGVFAQGLGMYNEETAQARAINTDTVMRFNEYIWESQQIRNQKYYKLQAERRKILNMDADKLYRRFRDTPEREDVTSGDALNVALDQLTDPKIYSAVAKSAQVKIAPEMIQAIPFEYASDAITVSMHDLSSNDSWPISLRDPAFAPEREAFQKAIRATLDEDEAGKLQPATIAAVKQTVMALKSKIDKTIPAGTPGRLDAENHIKSLAALTRMLQDPQLDQILASLDKYPGSTLGDLLSFMQAFNLRFGAATTPRQRAIYLELFPMLDTLRDEIVKAPSDSANVARAPLPDRHARPAEFFKGMDYDHFEPKDLTPPKPGNP